MNARAELAQALAATVGEIAADAKTLRQVLVDERTALHAADDRRLLDATARKTQLLQRLDALERERTHLLEQCVERDRSRPFAMARALVERPDAMATWDQALQSLKDCRALNQANGSAVEARLRQVRRALELLTGARHEGDLYGPQGSAEKLHRSQMLARV